MGKKISLFIDWTPVLILILALFYSIHESNLDIRIPIVLSGLVAAAIAIIFKGLSWKEIERKIIDSSEFFITPTVTLLVIGMLIGSWNIAGITPSIVYYGLKFMDPEAFLPLTLIVCSIISCGTGNSWITSATVGVVLVNVGEGFGIDKNIVAGAVVSGAYFGDKMSIFSNTTILAASMSGAKLFDHFKHMIYTAVPAYLLSLAIFTLLGINSIKIRVDNDSINRIRHAIEANFMISPYLLLLPAILIFLMLKNKNVIPTLFSFSILSGLVAIFYQNKSINEVLSSITYGYGNESGFEIIDGLFNTGGMTSMLWSISLIFCSFILIGIMEKSGMMKTVTEPLLKFAKTTRRLMTLAIITPAFLNVIFGDRAISIIVSGNIFREKFKKSELAAVELSRCVETSGTLTSPLIPWSTSGIAIITILDLSPWSYVPYCFFNILCPIIVLIYGFFKYNSIDLIKVYSRIKTAEKNNKIIRDEDKIEF